MEADHSSLVEDSDRARLEAVPQYRALIGRERQCGRGQALPSRVIGQRDMG